MLTNMEIVCALKQAPFRFPVRRLSQMNRLAVNGFLTKVINNPGITKIQPRNKKQPGTSLQHNLTINGQILPSLLISPINNQIVAKANVKSFPDQRLHQFLKLTPLNRAQVFLLNNCSKSF